MVLLYRRAKGRNVEGENSRRSVLPDNTPILRLDVNVLLRGALLLELGSCRGIQPAVVVVSFTTGVHPMPGQEQAPAGVPLEVFPTGAGLDAQPHYRTTLH
jgi:hypothetical protein